MTLEQRQNTINLLDIIKSKIDRGDPKEFLDTYYQPCGTIGCVLGDYVLKHKNKELSIYSYDAQSQTRAMRNFCCFGFCFEEEFGFSRGFYSYSAFDRRGDVIGLAKDGTLQERYNYVKSMLEIEEDNG